MSEPVLAWQLLAQTLGLPILYASSVSTSTTTHGRLRSTQIMTISKKRLLIFVTSADRIMPTMPTYIDREDEILTRIITDARSEMDGDDFEFDVIHHRFCFGPRGVAVRMDDQSLKLD